MTHKVSASSRPASSICHNKRKRENNTAFQRLVAQKLQFCADITDNVLSTQRARNDQLQRYVTQKARTEELDRLQLAIEQLTQFQLFCGAELEVEKARNGLLLTRLDKLLTKVANDKKPFAIRTQSVSRRLPRLMKKVTSLVLERRACLREQSELPPKHQWVPLILWRIYDQVTEAIETSALELKPLKCGMHHVMKTMTEKNPFYYLQILYQAPPEHLDQQWEIKASTHLMDVTATMKPFCRDLKARSLALRNKHDSHVRVYYGWNQLQHTLTSVKRTARHFHYLILHLYAMAMKCADSHVLPERGESEIWTDEFEVRSRLSLCPGLAHSNDYLIKESYEWTPELLVYVDEWRQLSEFQNLRFGFDRREQHETFLPQFLSENTKQKKQRFDVLTEIGTLLRRVHRVWHKSKLSSSAFESMTIQEIGMLEKRMKSSLGEIVNLIYKMNLARWMERKKRPLEWWASLQLRTKRDVSNTDKKEVKGIVTQVDSVQVTNKKDQRPSNRFRRPTTVTLRQLHAKTPTLSPKVELSNPSKDSVSTKVFDYNEPIRLCDVYAWTDKEIEVLARDSKRIAEIRGAMSSLGDRLRRLKVPQVAVKTTKAHDKPAVERDDMGDARRTVCMARHLCTLTKKAASFAEETAMHEAASALLKIPSLRGKKSNTDNAQDCKDGVESCDEAEFEELNKNVRKARTNVVDMLSQYNGEQSTKWRNVILFTGAAIADLLHTISQDEEVSGRGEK